MTSGASAVGNREISDPVRHDPPAELSLNYVARQQSTARLLHGWQELPIRHLRQPLTRTADADEALDEVVVRLEFLVADGPVFAIAVTGGGFECVIAIAVTFPRPT